MAMKDADKKIPNEDQKALEHAKAKGLINDQELTTEEQNEQQKPQKTNTARDNRPTVQADDTKVQNPSRNLPQGGNPVGRQAPEHNSTSGGKPINYNNARSNPTSDKTHN